MIRRLFYTSFIKTIVQYFFNVGNLTKHPCICGFRYPVIVQPVYCEDSASDAIVCTGHNNF